MTERSLSLVTTGPAHTQALGNLLGNLLNPGDILLLCGPLGSGKTTLVKGIAQGLGVEPEGVVSPTFTFIAEYRGRITLYHVDLYRLEKSSEMWELGLADYLYSGTGATVIEWAEKLPPGAVDDALRVDLEYRGDTVRKLTFTPCGPHSHRLLERLREALKTETRYAGYFALSPEVGE